MRGTNRHIMNARDRRAEAAENGAPTPGFRRIQTDVLPLVQESRFSKLSRYFKWTHHNNGEPKTYTVSIVTPTLRPSGAERWAASLAKAIQGDGIGCAALVVIDSKHPSDPVLSRRVRDACPLLTLEDDMTEVLKSDAIIVWGNAVLPEQLNCYSGQTVFTAHSSCPCDRQHFKKAADNGMHMVAVSRKSANYIPSDIGCTIIHNGVDLDRCGPSMPWEETRARWGASDDDILVGYIGRYHPAKRIEIMGHACAMLGGLYRPIYIGELSIGEECRLNKICPRSIFAGYMSHVGDALAAIDVMCLLSDSEAMSLSLCEAWAAKVPTVCTEVGAIEELQEQFGVITRSVKRNPSAEEVASEIQSALAPQNAASVVRAKNMAREYCSEEAMGRRWRAYIRSLLTEERNGVR